MSDKGWRFLLLIFVVLGISFYLFFKEFSTSKTTQGELFDQIPVSFFPFSEKPLIDVEIEKSKYRVEIDLGCSHPLTLQPAILENLKEKTAIGISKTADIKGNVYQRKKYRIPKVRLANKNLRQMEIFEENLDFFIRGSIWPDENHIDRVNKRWAYINGKMGWPIFFQLESCLFDFPNKKLVIGKDNIQMAASGFNKYVKIPFEIEKSGIIISANTEIGIRRFILDTGANHSFIRESLVNKANAREVFPGKWAFSSHLIIEGKDLGVQKLWLYDYSNIFTEFDGILGIDFFKDHAIYFDFCSKIAYIQL